MAVGKPDSLVTNSSIERPLFRLLYTNSNGVVTQKIFVKEHYESLPTLWRAVFINPVARPFDNVSDYLLAQMDNRNSWTLKPNPSLRFNAWNVEIRIPKEWRISHSIGGHYMDSNGAITAAYNLSPSSVGTEVIQSQFGNYQNSIPEYMEVDLRLPIFLLYAEG
ncbi:hypothetical protein KQX54_014882 [Cotesia glomerata]|uniref:Uncharacterized protein n=1 Tax=Cotesia glomerata TaxID=32391 RepID=A0AAV7IS83_COTGL|nr:hypothetical protein KQX54_014882 [Cotesia glomerata]